MYPNVIQLFSIINVQSRLDVLDRKEQLFSGFAMLLCDVHGVIDLIYNAVLPLQGNLPQAWGIIDLPWLQNTSQSIV